MDPMAFRRRFGQLSVAVALSVIKIDTSPKAGKFSASRFFHYGGYALARPPTIRCGHPCLWPNSAASLSRHSVRQNPDPDLLDGSIG
jgi:hypothetical protein